MKTINVAAATNVQLDWMVAKCLGIAVEVNYSASWRDTPKETNKTWHCYAGIKEYQPTTDWSQAGPIIERDAIFLAPGSDALFPSARASFSEEDGDTGWVTGDTILIAAMRCYCLSKLGEMVEVPEELF